MLIDILLMTLSLGVILVACVFFTNAIEWFGKKLNLSQGVIGSIFAAIGTALPETIIPIIAIAVYNDEHSRQVGIGAIAGAPFMLGTLALFVTGAAVFVNKAIGKRSLSVKADISIFSRDMTFFIMIYGVAVLTTFLHNIFWLRTTIAILLMLSYGLYIKKSFSDECAQCENLDPLFISRVFKIKTTMTVIVLQMLVSLAGIIYGAHLFVKYVESVSNSLGIAPLILSIIITPIATELPEKLNSVIWIGQGKDTLALGNISGAMVFQSCFPVAFGMIFTEWDLTGITMLSAVLALVSAAVNLLWVKLKKSISPYVLLLGGAIYSVFLIGVFV